MNTKSLYLLALLTLLAGFGSACMDKKPVNTATPRQPGNPIVVAVSPFLDAAQRTNTHEALEAFILSTNMPTGQKLTLVNGWDAKQVMEITMGSFSFDSPQARLSAHKKELLELSKFFSTNPAAGPLADSATLDVPRVFRNFAALAGQERPSLLLVGSPWRMDESKAVDMAGSRLIPNDAHLAASTEQSPFGLGDYKNRYHSEAVLFVTEGRINAQDEERLKVFFRKMTGLVGLKPFRFGTTLSEALNLASDPKGNELPGEELRPTGTPAMIPPMAAAHTLTSSAALQVATATAAGTAASASVPVTITVQAVQATNGPAPAPAAAAVVAAAPKPQVRPVATPAPASVTVTVASTPKANATRQAANSAPKQGVAASATTPTAHLPEAVPAFTHLPVENPIRGKVYIGIKWPSLAGAAPVDLDLHVAAGPEGEVLNYKNMKTSFGRHFRDLRAGGGECEYAELDGAVDLGKLAVYVNHFAGLTRETLSGVAILLANGKEYVGAFSLPPAEKENKGQDGPAPGETSKNPQWVKLDISQILRDGEVRIQTAAR